LHPLTTLHNQLQDRTGEIAKALPRHIRPDFFIRVAYNAVQNNLDLLTVDRRSFFNACLKAAADGLLPDGREGVIVNYKNKAQWQTMIGGLLKLFRNSGQFKSIATNIIRKGEEFRHFVDEDGEHLYHVPGPSDVEAVGAYAIANLRDGGKMIRVMDMAEINKRRAVSRAKDGPMWRDWPDEAAMKTVLRNLAKRLPTSADLDEIVRRDDNPAAFSDKPDMADDELDQAPSAPAVDPAVDAAFTEGAKARAAGVTRRAVPGHYRAPENNHLSRAWYSGWDSAEPSQTSQAVEVVEEIKNQE
jgi:recombination protein RecT